MPRVSNAWRILASWRAGLNAFLMAERAVRRLAVSEHVSRLPGPSARALASPSPGYRESRCVERCDLGDSVAARALGLRRTKAGCTGFHHGSMDRLAAC